MSNHEFTLKSGAKLRISTAAFEPAVNLVEAVKKASRGLSPELEIGDVVLFDPEVRKALFGVFPWVHYNNEAVTVGLLDDASKGETVRGDYLELCARVIEVNTKPFFLKTY